jgi:hypothetical protein
MLCPPCRLSTLWPAAAEALAKALEHASEVAWPLAVAALQRTQAAFLAGADRGTPPLDM